MEGEAVHVGEVAVEDSQRLGLVSCPEPGRSVMATGGEVVAKRGKGAIPYWEHMTLVANQTGPCVKRPEADHTVLPAREQQGLVGVEGKTIYGAAVPHQAL